MLAFILLVIGVVSRVMFHAPNFTPVIALALFGGMTLKKGQAVWMPLALMILSDLVIGLHGILVFTWGSVVLVSALGRRQRSRRSPLGILGAGTLSAVIFFLVTNFGAWLVMYPQTPEGLIQCYTLAIPFFRNTLISTLVYCGVLFGMHELVARRVRGTKFAWIAA